MTFWDSSKFSIKAIMKTLFFHVIKYDFKSHGRSHKAILDKFILAPSFINRF